MKKTIGLILAVVMILTLTASSALAVSAQYDNTRAFVKLLDQKNIKYTVIGIDDDNDEKITIENRGDHCDYSIRFFFADDNESVSLRVWNLIEYDAADLDKVLRAVNELNNSYKWVTFYADESDNTVTVSMDVILRNNEDAADMVFEAALHVVNIIDDGYEVIGTFSR